MKKLLFLILLLQTACTDSPAEQTHPDYSRSSGFTLDQPDSLSLDNLDVLGRVWGYVKYHHPVFASSTVDADYELFGLLPRVAHAKKEERNRLLYEWIESLGNYVPDPSFYDDLLADGNHRWLTRSEWIVPERLGNTLCEALHKMKYARRSHNRYVSAAYGADNPELTEEHRGGRIEDCGYRLLLLYRYWNAIEYFSPNRNSADRPWDSILPEFLPRFLTITGEKDFWSVYLQLNAALCDGHAFGPEYILTGTQLLPVQARYFGDRLIVTDAADLAPGDEIVSVDGVQCGAFRHRMRPFVAASNEETAAHYTARLALSSQQGSVDVTYLHDGRSNTKRIATLPSEAYYRHLAARDFARYGSFRLLNEEVGYLYAGSYRQSEAEKMMELFRPTKALIVDLRCYPSEFMIFDFVGRYFLSSPVHHVTWGKPIPTLPGLLLLQDARLTIGSFDRGDNPEPYRGHVIVLCDETTQSQAEYTVMAFQATPRCTVIGSRTAGADGNISYIPLPFGKQWIFTGLGVYYPDGTDTQRAGVRIDLEVRPTVEGIRAGRDEVLEKALELAAQSN